VKALSARDASQQQQQRRARLESGSRPAAFLASDKAKRSLFEQVPF